MWNKILYALLFAWVKLHAMLPMPVLYVLSDILYILIYRVMRYRLKVVRRNLKASFPDKSEIELRRLEREFYHHFADYIMETIKLAHISEEEVLRRAYIKNPELATQLQAEGQKTVMMLMGHYGNWEWFSSASMIFKDSRLWQIYRPLNNKAVDRLFVYLRTRFGSYGMKKNDTVRDMIQLKKEDSNNIVIFIADQTPSKANLHYWTTFLNQDTPILNGAERIARKLDLPVIFLDVQKVKRGFYTVEFKLMTAHAKQTAENEITESYARMTEKMILRNPAYWLWTHKRWKYKREDAER
ncbi:MAG: lysophospholipid acyltransferase family protein [Parabacteroides sp.]|nr:lysophospholipid acyltransferase family protein [Parabacteroides sp.]